MYLISPQLLTVSNVIMKNPLWPTSSLIGSSHRSSYPTTTFWNPPTFVNSNFEISSLYWRKLPLQPKMSKAFPKSQKCNSPNSRLSQLECVQIFATQIAHFIQKFYISISSFLQQNCSMYGFFRLASQLSRLTSHIPTVKWG